MIQRTVAFEKEATGSDWKGSDGAMVRKHYWRTRQRQKRTRPKTPAPTNSWPLAELAQLTGLPETTVRYYVANKLIRPIQVRGTATRYGRHDLMLLLGIARLRTDDTLTLTERNESSRRLTKAAVFSFRCYPAAIRQTEPLPASGNMLSRRTSAYWHLCGLRWIRVTRSSRTLAAIQLVATREGAIAPFHWTPNSRQLDSGRELELGMQEP